MKNMAFVRESVSDALKLRADAGLKVRQPIASAPMKKDLGKDLERVFLEEVNAKKVGAFDPVITQDLKEEGMAREIIRAIQDMRRELGMKPGEKIRVQFPVSGMLDRWRRRIAQETGIGAFVPEGNVLFPVRREVVFEHEKATISIDRTQQT